MIKWLLTISFLSFYSHSAVVCPRYLNVVPVQAIATPNDRLCCNGNNMQTAYQDAPQNFDDGSLKVATYLQTHVNNGMLVANKMEVVSQPGSNNIVNSNIRVQNISQNQNRLADMNSPGYFINQNQQSNSLNFPAQSSTSGPLTFTPIPNVWSGSSFNTNQPTNLFGQPYPSASNSQNMNGQGVNGQLQNGVINPTPMANSQNMNGQTVNGQMINTGFTTAPTTNGRMINGQTTNGLAPNAYTQSPLNTVRPNMDQQQLQTNFGNNEGTSNLFADRVTQSQPVTGYNNPTLENRNTFLDGQNPIYSNERGFSNPSSPNAFSTTSMPFYQNQPSITMQPNAQSTINSQNLNGIANPQQNTNRNFDYTSSTNVFSPTTQRPFTNGVQQSSSNPSNYMSTQFPNTMQNTAGTNNNNVVPSNSNPSFIQNEGINYVPNTSSTISTNGYSSSSALYTSPSTSSSPFIMSNANRGQTQIQSTTPFYPSSLNSQQAQTVTPYSQTTTTWNGRQDSSATTNQYNPSNPILSTSRIPTSYTPNGEGTDQFPNHVLYDSQRMINTQFGDYTSGKQFQSAVISLLAVLILNIIF